MKKCESCSTEYEVILSQKDHSRFCSQSCRTNTVKPWKQIVNNSPQNKSRWRRMKLTGRCEICGYSKHIERAHIVARASGGPDYMDNCLELCPNHHFEYDNKLMEINQYFLIMNKINTAKEKYKNNLVVI